jgi:hypothetical protein
MLWRIDSVGSADDMEGWTDKRGEADWKSFLDDHKRLG